MLELKENLYKMRRRAHKEGGIVIRFAFGAVHAKMDVGRLLEAIMHQLSTDFEISVAVGHLEEAPGPHRVDLALIDVSRELRSLHLSGLASVDRLFLVHGRPTKVASGLQHFMTSLSSLHGHAVRLIFDGSAQDEHVFQIDPELAPRALGFHAGTAGAAPDVRDLADALYQEYYSLRLEDLERKRIEHIVARLAQNAVHEAEVASTAPDAASAGTPVAAQGPVAADAASPPHSTDAPTITAAQRFLSGVLESLQVPFEIKQLFFRYITLRLSMGQSLQDAVTDLMPVVMKPDAYDAMYQKLRMELELQGLFAKLSN